MKSHPGIRRDSDAIDIKRAGGADERYRNVRPGVGGDGRSVKLLLAAGPTRCDGKADGIRPAGVRREKHVVSCASAKVEDPCPVGQCRHVDPAGDREIGECARNARSAGSRNRR